MKTGRVLLFGVFVALIATVSAQGQEGVSSNAVGFEMTVVARDSFGLIRYDFEALVGEATPETVFGLTTLPLGTALYIWDVAGSRYGIESLSSNKASGLTWSPGTNVLARGKGFWLKIPASAPAAQYSIYMVGEVPDAVTAPATVIPIFEGYNLVGYPYPTPITWSNTSLSKISTIGDSLYTFGGAGYQVNTLSSNKASGLAWTTPTQVLDIAEGYWFERTLGAGSMQWSEPKPYTWP